MLPLTAHAPWPSLNVWNRLLNDNHYHKQRTLLQRVQLFVTKEANAGIAKKMCRNVINVYH